MNKNQISNLSNLILLIKSEIYLVKLLTGEACLIYAYWIFYTCVISRYDWLLLFKDYLRKYQKILLKQFFQSYLYIFDYFL